MIYPRMTKSRMVFELNGIWDFRLLEADEVYAGERTAGKMLAMPVPSSFNDLYGGREFADHMGDMA